ncbi:MAG: hypothetical protein L6Q75_03500 [Burkholderiaceae bacterium]|nr:hypothetical protein [Burkholderiaceae bacterium]
MHLDPFIAVDGLPFTTTAPQLRARLGPPQSETRSTIELNELDYGDVVYRFQDSGRLEEVTRRADVVHIGSVSVPFFALQAFIAEHDPDHFERAGFIVSPKYGLAFVPDPSRWVTALAAHCIGTWRDMAA